MSSYSQSVPESVKWPLANMQNLRKYKKEKYSNDYEEEIFSFTSDSVERS